MKNLATRRADVRRKMESMVVTMRSVRVLRDSGLSGGPLDGLRSFTFAKKYGPFAGLVETAARRCGSAVALTDYAGDVTFDDLNRRVEEVAVVGVPDPDFGQRLKAFVVVADGGSLDGEALKDYVRANLARYQVPREVEFLDALPRNATGKVVRSKLQYGEVR